MTDRATRIAAITASEPVLQKVTRWLPVSRLTRAATSPARGDWGPMAKPALDCSETARVTMAGAWPKKVWP